MTAGPFAPAGLVVAALALAACAAAVLTIAGAHVRPGGHGHVPGAGGGAVAAPTLVRSRPPQTPQPTKRPRPSTATDVIGGVLLVLGLIGVGFGIVILTWLLRTVIYRRQLARMRHRAPPPAPPDAAGDLAVHLSAAVDDALFELGSTGPVSDSIIACWRRLEDAAARAGIPAAESDTAQDQVERIFAARQVRTEPLVTLADLYREARFSRHQMTGHDVDEARAALTQILAELGQDAGAVR